MRAQAIERQLCAALEKDFKAQVRGPRAGYIDSSVRAVRDGKMRLKQKYRGWYKTLPGIIKAAALQTWRLGAGMFPRVIRVTRVLGELLPSAIGYVQPG